MLYCEAQVRKFDYDRYLAALFAPERVRPGLFALYALNHEIARVAEVVRNPIAGQIRLQWWRDRIGEIYAGQTGRTEVLTAVATAVERHELPLAMFEQMIDARECDLEAVPFADLASMESYADATSGTLMRLAARVLGAGDALDESAHHAGTAYAITGLLRALPFQAAQSRVMMPKDELEKTGVEPDQLLRREMSAGLSALIGRMAAIARDRHARLGQAERRFLPAILPASLVPAYLRVLTGAEFNPFRDSSDVPGYRRQWIMLRAVARRRI